MQLRPRRPIDYKEKRIRSASPIRKLRNRSVDRRPGSEKRSAPKVKSSEPVVKRGRGRPRKSDLQITQKTENQFKTRSKSVPPRLELPIVSTVDANTSNIIQKKRRGRPPKIRYPNSSPSVQINRIDPNIGKKRKSEEEGNQVPVKRGRGRPKKVARQLQADEENSDAVVSGTLHPQPPKHVPLRKVAGIKKLSPSRPSIRAKPETEIENVSTQKNQDLHINKLRGFKVSNDVSHSTPPKIKKKMPPRKIHKKNTLPFVPARAEVPLELKYKDQKSTDFEDHVARAASPVQPESFSVNPNSTEVFFPARETDKEQWPSSSSKQTIRSIKQEPQGEVEEAVTFTGNLSITVKQEPSIHHSPPRQISSTPEQFLCSPDAILKEEDEAEDSDSDKSDDEENYGCDHDDDDDADNSSDDDEDEGGRGDSSNFTNSNYSPEYPGREWDHDQKVNDKRVTGGSKSGGQAEESTWLKSLNASLKPIDSQKMSAVPDGFHEMQELWTTIKESVSENVLQEYKRNLQGILTGRVSCLTPIKALIKEFPAKLLQTHERLYNLLCQYSGAFPFQNHNGTDLVSKHWLADSTKIGAQILLDCLVRNVLPFDVIGDSEICQRLEESVRIRVKDMLDEIIASSLRSKKKISEIPASIISKYLNP